MCKIIINIHHLWADIVHTYQGLGQTLNLILALLGPLHPPSWPQVRHQELCYREWQEGALAIYFTGIELYIEDVCTFPHL